MWSLLRAVSSPGGDRSNQRSHQQTCNFTLLVLVFKGTCRVMVKLGEGIPGKVTEPHSEGCVWINYQMGNYGHDEACQCVGTARAKVLVWRPLKDREKCQGRWNRVNKSKDTFMMRLELGAGACGPHGHPSCSEGKRENGEKKAN